jgi:hypothetical protein
MAPSELVSLRLMSSRHVVHPDPLEVSKKPDYQQYRPFFLHVDTDKIRKTFPLRSLLLIMSGHRIIQTIQSPYPAIMLSEERSRRIGHIFLEVAAICTNGQTIQIFLWSLRLSLISSECLLRNVNTLEDVIRSRGAGQAYYRQRSCRDLKQIVDILRSLCIDAWQSEPHYQHQNFANTDGSLQAQRRLVHELGIPGYGYYFLNGSLTS